MSKWVLRYFLERCQNNGTFQRPSQFRVFDVEMKLTFFFATPMTVKNAIAIIPKQHVAIIKCSSVFAKAPSSSPIFTPTLFPPTMFPPTPVSFSSSSSSFRSALLIIEITSLWTFDRLSNSYIKMNRISISSVYSTSSFWNQFNQSDITGYINLSKSSVSIILLNN